MSKKKQKNVVLVTVSGGVASTYAFGDVTTSEIDFDNWENADMTIGELMCLMDIFMQIDPKEPTRVELMREVGEIADRGLNYDDLNEFKVGYAQHDAEIAGAAKALRFFGFDDAADDIEGRHEEIKDKLARAQLAKKRA